MKLNTGLNILYGKNLDAKISKKILYANTNGKLQNQKVLNKAVGIPSDPLYLNNNDMFYASYNPDIRYRNYFQFSSLANIEYRNALLLFAENKKIKKAVKIMADEMVVVDSDAQRYPVQPDINITKLETEKQKVGTAIVDYLDNVFYPKLWRMYDFDSFGDGGIIDMLKEFLITGKLAWEIIYDSIKNPKDIIGLQPLDPTTLQKYKVGDDIYYVQRTVFDGRERILHENQVILVEWNKYDFGYVSYVDGLRLSYNIMNSMNTSKALWFAAKSQVRMHIRLALGDVSRDEAEQRLSEAAQRYTNNFKFSEDGVVLFNNQPNNSGYREFFTGETSVSGHPEIEEVNANGPDLTETDSLSYWEKLYWEDTGIPFDRIDPNNSDNWGFLDVESLKKTEIIFAKDVEAIRRMLNDIWMKPIIIQLTLKEVEIGIDLSLLDSIELKWASYNQYEKMADLGILEKKVGIAQNIKDFGTTMNAADKEVPFFSVNWLTRNILGYDEATIKLIKEARRLEYEELGFDENGCPKKEFVDASMGSLGDMGLGDMGGGSGDLDDLYGGSPEDEEPENSSDDEEHFVEDEEAISDSDDSQL